ncbi:MAG: Hpt domain-containing protein, partial [Mesotoga sp.]|nr:Hpt domain-containing protein [Mesotoga sp.]
GDLEVYRQVLNAYHRENRDTPDTLGKAIEERRYPDAVQIVHKVKSSSGSIGAKALYEVSVELQKALSDSSEEEIPPLKERFVSLLGKLLEEIGRFQN